ncbi:MAG: hypothetical protein JXR45_10275 [Deltaproteobacteria bacterium]|nr:hypothetical protein [Deltaproteobacteria bacterium]
MKELNNEEKIPYFEDIEQLFTHLTAEEETLDTDDYDESVTSQPSEINIGQQTFNLGSENDVENLGELLLAGSCIDMDGDLITVSKSWKRFCWVLPCSSVLHWPGYSTSVLKTKIENETVYIQVWKGYCQRFADWSWVPKSMRYNFPGGYGAEVGVYYKDPKRFILAFSCPFIWKFLASNQMASLFCKKKGIWWPWYNKKSKKFHPQISFDLYYKEKFLLSSQNSKTWWQTKWINENGFAKYMNENFEGKKWNSEMEKEMELRFTINSKSFEWKEGKIIEK